MKITDFLKENILFLDGGMGTLLQEQGLCVGELPERWNITHRDVVKNIHLDYFNAGSHVVNANTFGANCLKFSAEELEEVIRFAMENARAAQSESRTSQPKWVALDIGPTGKMLKPYGDLDFEDAVEIFAQTVRLGVKYGADLIFIETMNDAYETKAALLAAKENSALPVFVSNAYGEDGKLMTGANAQAMVAMLEGMGADAIGMNCSLGPRALASVAKEYLQYASIPVLLKPNAGLPKIENGKTVYDVTPEDFALAIAELVALGVRIVGGCCGSTPRYIQALADRCGKALPMPTEEKNDCVISSYTHAVCFGDAPILIGERINPTGKKRFKEALLRKDMDYILHEGIAQEEKGVHVLDVNVGMPEIDEVSMLEDAVCALQAVTALPLQIDTSNMQAMEAALRRYNGKALINSVNGKRESMEAVFPLAKKYGGVVIALTLDESGIPVRAEERVAIAKKILLVASAYGIRKKDIIFDPLALTISADTAAAKETLRAVRMIRQELGCHTSLGVSNVSFGLPQRDAVNSTFFAMALANGLSAAIMNPYSEQMMKTVFSYRALAGLDESCADYIAFAQSLPTETIAAPSTSLDNSKQNADAKDALSPLQRAIAKGLKDRAAILTAELLASAHAPLSIVQEEIIPALDKIGVGFEKKEVYLPELLMSAEAAKSAFEEIKKGMAETTASDKCCVVIATVKGDIHDIGKNIVKLLLENYGFDVVDLGRDVPPERIAEETVRRHAPIVGLSALMTTTVPAMEETIRILRKQAPFCKIIVGGAVLTKDYAAKIGADHYAKDAMETVRYAEIVQQEQAEKK